MEPGNQTMISPLTRHSFLLSSRTVFMLLSQCRAHCILKYHKTRNLTSTTLALQFSCTIKSNILIKSLRIVDCMKGYEKHETPTICKRLLLQRHSIHRASTGPSNMTWDGQIKKQSKAVAIVANVKISQGYGIEFWALLPMMIRLCSIPCSISDFLTPFQPFPSERKSGQTFAICHPCESEN